LNSHIRQDYRIYKIDKIQSVNPEDLMNHVAIQHELDRIAGFTRLTRFNPVNPENLMNPVAIQQELDRIAGFTD
jgi:hypothetical protein